MTYAPIFPFSLLMDNQTRTVWKAIGKSQLIVSLWSSLVLLISHLYSRWQPSLRLLYLSTNHVPRTGATYSLFPPMKWVVPSAHASPPKGSVVMTRSLHSFFKGASPFADDMATADRLTYHSVIGYQTEFLLLPSSALNSPPHVEAFSGITFFHLLLRLVTYRVNFSNLVIKLNDGIFYISGIHNLTLCHFNHSSVRVFHSKSQL